MDRDHVASSKGRKRKTPAVPNLESDVPAKKQKPYVVLASNSTFLFPLIVSG